MKPTTKPITVTDLLGTEPATFRPVAYYDSHMDCIRIELRDCSITERRFDEVLTVLYDNYPEVNQHDRAGLMIKGVKHLFKELNLPTEGIVKVTEVLDKLAEKYPNVVDKEVCRVVADIELTVDLDEAIAA
ncbi:MAG: hypothetical protein WAO00_14070 [Chthoniobacterales bacterium]